MKRFFLVLSTLAALAPLQCKHAEATPVAAPPAEAPPPTLTESVDAILEAWFRADPVTATALGDHRWDDRWPDIDAQGIAADLQRIDAGLALLEEVATGDPSTDDRIDLEIIRTELKRQRFVHEVEQPWARNPMWYAQVVGSGLEDLVSREFAPLPDRARSMAARLEGLPAWIDQARTNLDPARAMAPHAEVAVGQLEGVVQLIEDEIPQRLAAAPEGLRTRIDAARGPAVAAVRELQRFIRDEVLPRAQGSWRLGAEHFGRKLQLTLHSDMDADALRRLAEREHAEVRQRMAALARELAVVLFTPAALRRIEAQAGDDPDTAVTRAVLEALSAHHVEPSALRDAVERKLQHLTAFVNDRGIVTMDDREVLQVIWTPPHARGVFIAGLAPPGPLDAKDDKLPSFYLVQPVPESWTPEQRESFLREYNDFMLEILSIHEAIPGHFVQLYLGNRNPSKVRRVLQDGAFVEGWAVYAEKVMVEAGYAGTGPGEGATRPRAIDARLWKVITTPDLRAKAIALHGLKFYLRSVTNAILDHAIHTGDMSRDEALALMIERSFQQEGEAIGKWVRAQVTSTQLSTYFVGAQAWMRLRERAQARATQTGETFDLRAFHDAALSHGAPPVHTLPTLLGWEPRETQGDASADATVESAAPAATR